MYKNIVLGSCNFIIDIILDSIYFISIYTINSNYSIKLIDLYILFTLILRNEIIAKKVLIINEDVFYIVLKLH